MRYNEKQVTKFLNALEKIVFGLCLIYGLMLILMYASFGGRMMPCFLDPLLIGLIFLLIGIYPAVKKKGLERLRKKKRLF